MDIELFEANQENVTQIVDLLGMCDFYVPAKAEYYTLFGVFLSVDGDICRLEFAGEKCDDIKCVHIPADTNLTECDVLTLVRDHGLIPTPRLGCSNCKQAAEAEDEYDDEEEDIDTSGDLPDLVKLIIAASLITGSDRKS